MKSAECEYCEAVAWKDDKCQNCGAYRCKPKYDTKATPTLYYMGEPVTNTEHLERLRNDEQYRKAYIEYDGLQIWLRRR
jgi:hypothetical protein